MGLRVLGSGLSSTPICSSPVDKGRQLGIKSTLTVVSRSLASCKPSSWSLRTNPLDWLLVWFLWLWCSSHSSNNIPIILMADNYRDQPTTRSSSPPSTSTTLTSKIRDCRHTFLPKNCWGLPKGSQHIRPRVATNKKSAYMEHRSRAR